MGHLIFGDAVAKTYASAILLREFYQNQDIDYIRARDWRYYFIVRRYFLRKMKAEHGGIWICHYCQKHMTVLQKRGKRYSSRQAVTIDHKHALANGGMLLDTANMVECCSKCNQKKGDKGYHTYMNSLN
jgi:5-methylcytosine-specific restriction endonuclease McrA